MLTSLPLVSDLHHSAMRERHWQQLMKVSPLACRQAGWLLYVATGVHRPALKCLLLQSAPRSMSCAYRPPARILSWTTNSIWATCSSWSCTTMWTPAGDSCNCMHDCRQPATSVDWC